MALQGINYWVGTFLAIGLFDAGLLGAIASLGQLLGGRRGVRMGPLPEPQGPRGARGSTSSTSSCWSAQVAWCSSPPRQTLVMVTLFVQVIAVTLLPAALVFLLLLLNNEELMGKYKNNRTQNIIGFSIVAMIIALVDHVRVDHAVPQPVGRCLGWPTEKSTGMIKGFLKNRLRPFRGDHQEVQDPKDQDDPAGEDGPCFF